MGELEELHKKESQIWAQMKTLHEEVAADNNGKFENLKKALQDLQSRTRLKTDRIRILLQTKQERFTTQLQTMLDRGWPDGQHRQWHSTHTERTGKIGIERKTDPMRGGRGSKSNNNYRKKGD